MTKAPNLGNKVFSFKKPSRSVKRVFIHCSDSDYPQHDNVFTIDQWHRKRGWNCIGYHFFINKAGEVFYGRDIEEVPSAQEGYNTNSITVCCSGAQNFTKNQFLSLREFCQQINIAYNKEITFHGHCEVSTKLCPVFDYKSVLNLSGGYIQESIPRGTILTNPAEPTSSQEPNPKVKTPTEIAPTPRLVVPQSIPPKEVSFWSKVKSILS